MKSALITGATRGIGRSIVKELLENGFRVYALSRSEEDLKSLSEQYKNEMVRYLPVDITNKEAANSIRNWLSEYENSLNVLINNAGGFMGEGSLAELSLGDWSKTFELNCFAPAQLTQTMIPFLKKSESAAILNITSTSAAEPGVWNPHYSASKAALANLTSSMAKWLGPQIRANALCLGPVKTEALTKQEGFDEERMKERLITQRLADPAEVARAALFLISDSNSWITGSHFVVDGGRLSRA